ncbi:hypothetical protein MUK42_36982 [Musa troglodytarum]|uniref:Uncharacterized protein n=1 Tax=Musa troglodytarum TaxID=320322 RepID=A0A9E7HKC7_9LILI|nr:hypothetical protein MUK42_36982 [Musa troglodytarum]
MDRREAAGPKSRDPPTLLPRSPRAIPEAYGNTLPYDLCSEMGGARGRGWCWCSTWWHMHSPFAPPQPPPEMLVKLSEREGLDHELFSKAKARGRKPTRHCIHAQEDNDDLCPRVARVND